MFDVTAVTVTSAPLQMSVADTWIASITGSATTVTVA